MAMTNAERQARFKAKQKALAAGNGVIGVDHVLAWWKQADAIQREELLEQLYDDPYFGKFLDDTVEASIHDYAHEWGYVKVDQDQTPADAP